MTMRPKSPRQEESRRYYERHRAEILERQRQWRERNPEHSKEYHRQHRLLYPDRILDQTFRKRYGIGLDTYYQMLDAQGGVCAICGLAEQRLANTGKPRRFLAVDHDHITGRVRGLLCASCNAALGQLGDDPERIRAAADYIERSRTEVVS